MSAKFEREAAPPRTDGALRIPARLFDKRKEEIA